MKKKLPNISIFCRFGIHIVGWSSDGDPRLLSAMCIEIVRDPASHVEYVQDMVHIATKLRNKLLNAKTMNMGNRNVSIVHLHQLLSTVQKSVHGLTKTDVCPQDRQNFESFMSITNTRVIESLKNTIPNCEATVKYLEVCSDIVSSYLDHKIDPMERIFRMYRSIFFLRIWRNHINCSPYHTLHDNFLTSNAYTCVEINGRSMLNLIEKLRQNNTPQLFLPPIFDSQTCEKMFRQLRSMGTVNFTKINFSLYEIIHMIGRIELQNNIAYFKFPEKTVSFPIDHKRSQKTQIYDLPSHADVEIALEKAKRIAIADGIFFGMRPENFEQYEIHSRVVDETHDQYDNANILLEGDIEENDTNENINENAIENSPFTTIIDENGTEVVVRKSTLVWMLSERSISISKDRLRRVQVSNINN